MKCQACEQPATLHVTEMVDGKAVEFHVCETHLAQLDDLKPVKLPGGGGPFWEFCGDYELRTAMREPATKQVMAAHLLPALCLAIRDANPEARILAAFELMKLGSDARSALYALRDAQRDTDARVSKAATLAVKLIESNERPPMLF
jgi:hypothetical protein